MSIIYSYPEQGALNANDLLIGTSATKVGGKQKNITRNFSVQQIADFINRGAGFVDPVATDFQIPVFNQSGTKITGSIMSQDTFPNGTGITIAGALATTGSISTTSDLSAFGAVTLGSQNNLISLNSTTKLGGPIQDASGTLGNVNQILLSNSSGNVSWANYEAGLTYEGTWNAANNTTNGLSNSPALVSGIGVSGHFYIVNVAGNTTLDTNSDWHVGDWAVFLDQGGQPAAWQKIDNTSALVGSGTAGTLSKWTTPTTLGNSLISETGTVVSVNGDLKVKDTIQATTTSSNLKLKGNGTGGVEIMSADGTTDGKITLNCSQNSHGVTLQSPAHASGATYTLVLPTTTGTAGQILTTAGGSNSQLTWTSPLGNVIQAISGPLTSGTIPIANGAYSVTDSIMSYTGTVISVNGDFSTQGLEVNKYLTDGTGSNGTDGQVLTSTTSGTDKEILWVNASTIGDTYTLSAGSKSGSSVPLNLDAATGSDSVVNLTEGTGITLTQTSATEITITGSAQGVTSVNGDALTISSTGGTTPAISAITTGGVGSGLTNLATGGQIQTAIDTALAGTLTFKGTFNAASGFVTSGINNGLQLYSGTAGVIAITQGDFYIADTAGSFYNTTAMNVGDEAIALFTVAAAPPGSAITDWSVVPAQSSGGTVTSVGLSTDVAALAVTNSPVTGSGVLTLNRNGGAAGQYIDGATGAWTDLPASGVTSVSQGTPFTSTGLPLLISPASGSVVVSSAVYNGGSNIGIVPDGGTPTTFLKGDGQWATPTGASATITTRSTTTADAITTVFALGATPNGGSTSFVDVFVDGVYQEISTYSVTGTTNITFGTAMPSGVTVETKTISDYNVGAAVQSVNGMTGAVLISNPQYVAGNINPAVNGGLYIFDSTTTARTITLPGSPSLGDSIKISNRGGLATNVLAANGNKIMGVAADLTINNVTAAFEIIWAAGSQGWVIIGNV